MPGGIAPASLPAASARWRRGSNVRWPPSPTTPGSTERAEQLKAQGFEPTRAWIPHNEHFLWYAALMEGRGELALATARQRAERNAKLDHPFGEYMRALPLVTLLRFERWAEVLAEPVPQGGKHVATTLGAHARGVALARLGRVDEAAGRSYAEHLADHPDNGRALRGALRVASAQGRDGERQALQERLRRAWPQADISAGLR
jgi:hypothetical protein